MLKKYQIFISSTYEDLKDESRFARDAILNMQQFPIGMEQFSAGNAKQWEVIKTAIDTSDYYILILGKRYGSEGEDGVGYTEKEFRYAQKQNIPILAFIKSDNARFETDAIETDSKKKEKLIIFINDVKSSHMVKWFNNPYELAYQIVTALHNEIAKSDRPGWIRGELSTDTLNEREDDYDDNPLAPVECYEFYTHQIPADGKHKEINYKNEAIAEGLYKDGQLLSGTEFDCLIHITNGKLIYKPNCPEDPYDATEDFAYERMEQYGWEELDSFGWSESEIEHEGLDKFYVVDMEVTGTSEQMVNIRTLEEFLEKKNPKELEYLKNLIAIERED